MWVRHQAPDPCIAGKQQKQVDEGRQHRSFNQHWAASIRRSRHHPIARFTLPSDTQHWAASICLSQHPSQTLHLMHLCPAPHPSTPSTDLPADTPANSNSPLAPLSAPHPSTPSTGDLSLLEWAPHHTTCSPPCPCPEAHPSTPSTGSRATAPGSRPRCPSAPQSSPLGWRYTREEKTRQTRTCARSAGWGREERGVVHWQMSGAGYLRQQTCTGAGAPAGGTFTVSCGAACNPSHRPRRVVSKSHPVQEVLRPKSSPWPAQPKRSRSWATGRRRGR